MQDGSVYHRRVLLPRRVRFFLLTVLMAFVPALSASGAQPTKDEIIEQLNSGELTPEAVEALKKNPEFKDLLPSDVLKGKEMIEKRDRAAKEKEPDKSRKETVKHNEKGPVHTKETGPAEKSGPASLFDRYSDPSGSVQGHADIRPFGYELFSGADLTPAQDLPVASDYMIGPGDEINILMWGRLSAQYSLTVSKDGTIQFPDIGPIQVAGMTYSEMSAAVSRKAKNIIGAQVSVTMGRLRSIQVFVLGEVTQPGAYTVSAMSTITNALLYSGGPTAIGSLRKIELKRANKTITVMDFYDLLLKGDKSTDFRLQNGDVIFVPVTGPLIGVTGNVKRPAVYEFRENPDLYTVLEMSGGIIPTAYTQQIQVERIEKNERRVILDIDARESASLKKLKLQDADLVKVFSIIGGDANAVYLHGNVKRPGKYELKDGMLLSDILRSEADLLKETYLDYGVIKRIVPATGATELVPFNPGRLLDGANDEDLPLSAQDSIYVFSKWFFKDIPAITVEGEVRFPGSFDLEGNLTVKDLVLYAGDLRKDAYLDKAEIIRVNAGREFETIFIDLGRAMAEDPEHNLVMMDEDTLIVHSVWEERWKEFVTIEGEIKYPESYLLTGGMRIKDLVFKAGNFTRDAWYEEAELYRTDPITKDVTLLKFSVSKAIEGDKEHNIELKDQDKVVIHSAWEKVAPQNVSIHGEVNMPGEYPYAVNMTVRELVFAAKNLPDSAYLEEAEIASSEVALGKSYTVAYRKVDLRKAMEGDPAHNIDLKPYDSLFVRRVPGWNEDTFVELRGEVRFPGTYFISKGEKLSSVIRRAGGFTERAYLRGSVFRRESVRELQQKQLDESIGRLERELFAHSAIEIKGSVTPEEAEQQKTGAEELKKLIEKMRAVKAEGRMVVRVESMDMLEGSQSDIVLEAGDSLTMPEQPSQVQVIGAVNNQVALMHESGASVNSYIGRAGGYTKTADTGEVYILKVDGTAVSKRGSKWGLRWDSERRSWLGGGLMSAKLDPGDTIVVPEKLDHKAWVKDTKDITQILYQIAVTAGVLLVAF